MDAEVAARLELVRIRQRHDRLREVNRSAIGELCRGALLADGSGEVLGDCHPDAGLVPIVDGRNRTLILECRQCERMVLELPL